eukprot:6697886-Pyramimonas_sp.AAC.1
MQWAQVVYDVVLDTLGSGYSTMWWCWLPSEVLVLATLLIKERFIGGCILRHSTESVLGDIAARGLLIYLHAV